MAYEGGCYCKRVRYVAEGEPAFKGECCCRECQYIAGGAPNFFMLMPLPSFRYVKGEPKRFTRDDISNPVTREFCEACGTHLTTRSPALPHAVILKVGTLDNPMVYGGPAVAINVADKQSFHLIAEGVATFDRLPPM